MSAGTLYVAPTGTPKPDMGVTGRTFHGPWGPAWEVGVRCDISVNIGTNFVRDEMVIDVMPAERATGALYRVVDLGVPYALGYESGDHTERYVFPVILGVEMLARRNSPIGYRFTAAAADVTLHAAAGPGSWGSAASGRSFTAVSGSPPPAPVPARSAPYGGEAVELVPGRLRGFREWKVLPGVDGASPRLASITANAVWPWTPTVEAHCLRGEIVRGGRTSFADIPSHDPDEVPSAACSCGIYAKHKPAASNQIGMIAGVIEAWGKVEVGTNGFRARYARLVALANTTRMRQFGTRAMRAASDGTLAALAELYRVPTFTDDRDMWAQYPASDVRSLLGQPPEPPPSPPCPGCVANRHGDFAIHDPTCRRDRFVHSNHAHISMTPGGPVTGPPSTASAVTWQQIMRLATWV